MQSLRLVVRRGVVGALALFATAGCSGAATPDSSCSETADKWYRRAAQDYQIADIEEARDSVQKATALCPDDKTRILAARIALARLDYAETLRLLKDTPSSEAAGLRGRALWYKGELDGAADQLEQLLNDPDVKDDWAKSIAKLARRGAGRTPFTISGGLLAPVEMVRVSQVAPFFVVPVEIDGESALAMVSTGTAEVVVDSSTRQEPSWVSLRFGRRLEVHDVPALPQDLSGLSKQIGAPVKALLGVNLLRHINATMDYGGAQFVARSFTPPPPPNATRVDLAYIRGGGMVLTGTIGPDKGTRASLLVDTSMTFPIALDKEGWKKAGIDAASLKVVPEDPEQKLREGVVPMVRIGAYDVPKVPGVLGAPIEDIEKVLTLDLDGVLGAGLLAHFRITFGDGGRLLWLEDHTVVERMLRGNGPPQGPRGEGPTPADQAEPAPEPAATPAPASAPAATEAKPKPASKESPKEKAPASKPGPKRAPASKKE